MTTLHVEADWNQALNRVIDSTTQHDCPIAVLWHDDSKPGDDVDFGAVLALTPNNVISLDLGTLNFAERRFVPKPADPDAKCLQYAAGRDLLHTAAALEHAVAPIVYDLLEAKDVREFHVELLYVALGATLDNAPETPPPH